MSCLSLFYAGGQSLATHDKQLPQPNPTKRVSLAEDYGKLPLSFEANHGQVDSQVRFLSRGNGYSLFLTDRAAVLSLRRADSPLVPKSAVASRLVPQQSASFKTDVVRMELAGASHHLHVAGDSQLPGTANYFIGNDPAKWRSAVPTYGRVKYDHVYPGVDLVYYGNQNQLEYDFVVAPNADPKPIRLHFAGATGLKLSPKGDLEVIAKNGEIAFHKPVIYQEISGKRKEVEGSFRLLSKSNVAFTLGAYDHSEKIVIDPTLVYSTYLGGSGSASGVFSGVNGAQTTAFAVDADGNAYIAGNTSSLDFPTTSSALQPGAAQGPINEFGSYPFIAKMDTTGTTLLYATYLGGTGQSVSSVAFGTIPVGLYDDSVSGLAIDSSGNAYVVGTAFSPDFPFTAGAFQSTNLSAFHGGPNGFVTKLNSTGTRLEYSTYLGGTGESAGLGGDLCIQVAVDSLGEAYVVSQGTSLDFPLSANPYQSAPSVIHISKLNAVGSALVYSTYLGGSNGRLDQVNAVAVDSTGSAYVVGQTADQNFPVTPGSYQQINMASAANSNSEPTGFIAKLNAAGSGTVYVTFLGGSGTNLLSNLDAPFRGDTVKGVAVDSAGNAYVTGLTGSTDFPVTSGAVQSRNKVVASPNPTGSVTRTNAFVAKLNSAGTNLGFSTYLGSSSGEDMSGFSHIVLDSSNAVYVTGTTYGTDFPLTVNAIQGGNNSTGHTGTCITSYGGTCVATGNAYLSKLSSAGSLLYSSYFGGSGHSLYSIQGGAATSFSSYSGDFGVGVGLDGAGKVYLAGTAQSADLATTPGSFQQSKAALTQSAAFVAKFDLSDPASSGTITTILSSANPQNPNVNITFTAGVQSISGTGIPTGTVVFSVDGNAASTGALDTTGHARFSTTTLLDGTHTITAAYSGSSSYTSSSNTVTQLIDTGDATIQTLSGSNQTTLVGTPFQQQLVAQVQDLSGVPVPGSAVLFSGTGLSFAPNPAYTDFSGKASTRALATASGKLTAVARDYSVTNPSYFSLNATATASASALRFVSMSPCRVVDTRGSAGAFGSPELAAGASREFDLPQSSCGIPSTAVAYSLNVTVVPDKVLQYLTLWPAGQSQPDVSTLNSYDGRVKANAAITPAGSNGGVNVFVSDASNVILDVNGYFVPEDTTSALAFYPLTPCRVADTRGGTDALGGPFLSGQTGRSFPILSSACAIPANVQAYSLNVTTIPHKTLNYLTTWPTGQPQPNVSTLNAPTGAVAANAAIVPAGDSGAISIFVSDDADVILDVNGYFGPPAAGGLSLHTAQPCRVLDTRGLLGVFNGVLPVPIETGVCPQPIGAQAYVVNATVVPPGPLVYLTLWPDSESRPNVSTLNADDAAITSNMAIIPTTNGQIDAFSSNATQLILDITSYFAP